MRAAVLIGLLAFTSCAHGPHARWQPGTYDGMSKRLPKPAQKECVDPILRAEAR